MLEVMLDRAIASNRLNAANLTQSIRRFPVFVNRPDASRALGAKAKDKVFVSHCRRRRKESLISWPAAQTWACSERAD